MRGLTCSLNGSGSTDTDGTIAASKWSCGDGTPAGTGATPSHTYSTAGTYQVTLTVTDNSGETGSTTRQATVTTRRCRSAATSPSAMPSAAPETCSDRRLTIPSDVASGDTMIMYLSINRETTISNPAGWTVVGDQSGPNDELQTRVWSRVADATDAGKQVTVPLAATSKFALTVAAYSGVDQTTPVAAATSMSETTFQAAHTTPTVQEGGPGSWLLSYWTDKTSATTDWTPPDGQSVRAEVIGTSGGRVTALLTDAQGGGGGMIATADAASSKAVMWSIVLNSA